MDSPSLLTYRPALPDDADVIAPLIYRIDPLSFDHLFNDLLQGLSPIDVIAICFRAPGGMFSWRSTEVALQDGWLAGFLIAYDAHSPQSSFMHLGRAIGHYGVRVLMRLAWRGLALSRIAKQCLPHSWYVAFVGVNPDVQSRGIGSSLLLRSMEAARSAGCTQVELDVDMNNPRAQALYERLGFSIRSETSGSDVPRLAGFAGSRRMIYVPKSGRQP
jgi:ribosomal protein S18 acetylase RimI-like enzyme